MNRWSLYSHVRGRLLAAGFSGDQAADAARIASNALREKRNECIRACRMAGWPFRKLARVWGIDAAMVSRICAGVALHRE